MELFFHIFNYVFTVIMVGISFTWIYLIKSMKDSFRLTPRLDEYQISEIKNPKVSIILPARNEEEYIGKCLDSLLDQNYEDYEIIAIDDSSEDKTGKIISEYAKKNKKIVHVSANPKPDGWMGKNWACIEGYKKASGDLLLFTDSDTTHSKNVIKHAVSNLIVNDLDALTAIPKMISLDWWTKVTLPVISTFLHTRFSALRVNDPKKKTGYFFGSFFIIKRKVYDAVGTHESVRQEIVEDGALGNNVKSMGFKMKMVKGDHLIDAIWARDRSTLWHALKRLMIPLYLQSSKIAVGIFVAVLFLLFIPFVMVSLSLVFFVSEPSHHALFISSLIASLLIYLGIMIEAKNALYIKLRYTVAGPLGSVFIVIAFMSGILQAKKNSAVVWRGRSYSMKDHVPRSLRV